MVVEAGPFGDAVVVFAREQAARERGPDRGAVFELVEKGRVFDLEAVAVEGVVLGLFGDGGDEVVFFRNLRRFHDLHGGPLASAPVVGQVQVPDGLREALDDFFHGGGVIGAVRKDDVDVWCLQSCQRALQPFDDMFSGQTARVGFFSAGAEENFGDEDVFVAGPRKLFESVAHLDFGLATRISLCYCARSERVSNAAAG